ncbi:hypothetical protein [Frankia sp. CiP3]|uniref:hypothetical protein n=1 Tax=Frankia sp. CiP3 TaxID=2880971 RepID=UPI001EF6A31F|nr:hypothetical protein [Frankia sp. CiP3]
MRATRRQRACGYREAAGVPGNIEALGRVLRQAASSVNRARAGIAAYHQQLTGSPFTTGQPVTAIAM